MLFFLSKGYRVVAHDRRGHGRPTQTDSGNDMDTYPSDVEDLVEPGQVQAAHDAALVDHQERRHLPVQVFPGQAGAGVAVDGQLSKVHAHARQVVAHHSRLQAVAAAVDDDVHAAIAPNAPRRVNAGTGTYRNVRWPP